MTSHAATLRVLPWLLASLGGLAACGPQGFHGVDHRAFYGAWSVLESTDVPEGVREGAIRMQGSQADGRDATFVRYDRTLHGPDSLTPGCTGELWRRGTAVATTPEVRGPDPGDPRFPQGRTAEVGEMAFTVEEAIVRRFDCDEPADAVDLEDAPGVLTPIGEDPEPVPYSRPTDETWWIGGPRDILVRKRDGDERPDLDWPAD